MIDFEYLHRGLCGLARAHRAGAMAGHLGAAVVAGYFFGEDHADLPPEVSQAIEGELDRIIRGEESLWYDPKKVGLTVPELFTPFGDQTADEGRISDIPQALAANIERTRQSGHNVIFASIAVRALRDHPEYATAPMVDGIVKLIRAFDSAGPGRGYYGKQRGWMAGSTVPLATGQATVYPDEQTMIDTVIGELIRSASVRRQGYGGLFHLINHANGLIELARFGHRDLARKGLAAHRHHLQLWQSLPDVENELGALKKAQHDPRTPEYWRTSGASQWSARLTHRVKTLYGFFGLLQGIEDPQVVARAVDAFGYLMA